MKNFLVRIIDNKLKKETGDMEKYIFHKEFSAKNKQKARKVAKRNGYSKPRYVIGNVIEIDENRNLKYK